MSLMDLNGELWPRKMALEYTSVDFTNLVRFLENLWIAKFVKNIREGDMQVLN